MMLFELDIFATNPEVNVISVLAPLITTLLTVYSSTSSPFLISNLSLADISGLFPVITYCPEISITVSPIDLLEDKRDVAICGGKNSSLLDINVLLLEESTNSKQL